MWHSTLQEQGKFDHIVMSTTSSGSASKDMIGSKTTTFFKNPNPCVFDKVGVFLSELVSISQKPITSDSNDTLDQIISKMK